MKPANIFQQYVWLINTLLQYKRLTLEEISQHWADDMVIDGNPMTRVSFYRHKDAILNMFGIIIECDKEHGYKYYIANPEVLSDDSISLKDHILLEIVPAGEEYLQTIIQAIKLEGTSKYGLSSW